MRSRLEATASGREFLKAWDDWMARHGHHARAELDVAQPRWREEPDYVLETLRAWLQAEGTRSPRDACAQTLASRERLERECSSRLGWLRRRLFRALLTRAQRGLRCRENWRSESVRRLALTRAALLELGRRLARAGALEAPGDVFFLSLAELRAAVAEPRSGRWRAAAFQARREYDRWLPLTPPPVVVGRLNPADAVPAAVPDAPVLKGLAVSPGLVEGTARVVLRSDQESRLVPGEILVAPFTDPGWAPYFVAAKAWSSTWAGCSRTAASSPASTGSPRWSTSAAARGGSAPGRGCASTGSAGRCPSSPSRAKAQIHPLLGQVSDVDQLTIVDATVSDAPPMTSAYGVFLGGDRVFFAGNSVDLGGTATPLSASHDAGVYVYGRHPTKKVLVGGEIRKVRKRRRAE